MSLIPIDAEYHFVQDTAPTTANAGDVWLDTSQNPPVAKIYADVGNGLEWLKDQVSSRIDIPVSSAGASISDIEQGAEDALEEDIANLSPASNSVAANLDGGVAAVDWANKTPKLTTVATGTSQTINGSGFLQSVWPVRLNGGDCDINVTIDSTQIVFGYQLMGGDASVKGLTCIWPFDSSLTVEETSDDFCDVEVIYVLD